MESRKPKRLARGDTVAVLSPSWGGPSLYPHVFELGLRNLESIFGLKIKEFPTARMDDAFIYQHPEIRAKDVNDAFADSEVSAIIASIGGDDSVRILPFLDLGAILGNPKIFMGYSDTTAISSFLCSNGLTTFNGPSIMAGFAQMHHLPDAFEAHVRNVLFLEPGEKRLHPYDEWTDHYIAWSTPGYDGETAPLQQNSDGWHWLQGDGKWTGRLFGGCIEVLEFIKGTDFWPCREFFDGKILFFETSEDKPTVSNVKYMLRNYGSMGVYDRIEGILFGRARSYTDAEKLDLEGMLVKIVAGEFGRRDLPIVANMDFGHTDPQFILPLGCLLEIDCAGRSISYGEYAVV